MKRTSIKRGKPLAPGGPLPRKGSRPGRGAPIKPINRKRAAANRKRNFGPEADAVERMPCLAGVAFASLRPTIGGLHSLRGCCGDVVAAHVTARGMGAAKGCCMDIVPLCSAHHEEAGEARTSQRAAFEARYGLDLRREADRIAVGHEPPLGIRGLAQRWAMFESAQHDPIAAFKTTWWGKSPPRAEWLDDHERDALMGWVRREMEREAGRRSDGQVGADEPSFAWDREALANRIMQALGAPFTEDTHGEHGLTWTLCEAAGWPS